MILMQGGARLAWLRTLDRQSVDSIVTDPQCGGVRVSPEHDIAQLKRWVNDNAELFDSELPGPTLWRECFRVLKPGAHMLVFSSSSAMDMLGIAIRLAGFEIRDQIMWFHGEISGTGKHDSKPAYAPIIMARKPLAGTVVENVQTYRTGALHIGACRVVSATAEFDANAGRWPANLIHDGSSTVQRAFPKALGQQGDLKNSKTIRKSPNGCFGDMPKPYDHLARKEEDKNASRFFFNTETGDLPNARPIELLRYLCRLVTPPNGVVLDPFAQHMRTLDAAQQEGFRAMGIRC